MIITIITTITIPIIVIVRRHQAQPRKFAHIFTIVWYSGVQSSRVRGCSRLVFGGGRLEFGGVVWSWGPTSIEMRRVHGN